MKLDFYSIKKMRSGNREEFVRFVGMNFPSTDVLNGELHFRVEGKRPDGSIYKEDKYIFLSADEKKDVISLIRSINREKADKIIEEGNNRYESLEGNKTLRDMMNMFNNREIATIIAMSVEDEPVTEEVFLKACNALEKNKEIGGAFWKSYRFKGFIRWSQTKEMLDFYARNINPSEIIHVSEPVKTN